MRQAAEAKSQEQDESRIRGRFRKGFSGNPGGFSKKGREQSRKAREQALMLLHANAEQLVTTCIKQALEGDMKAMKLCLERILPSTKDEGQQKGAVYLGFQIVAPDGRKLEVMRNTNVIEGEVE